MSNAHVLQLLKSLSMLTKEDFVPGLLKDKAKEAFFKHDF